MPKWQDFSSTVLQAAGMISVQAECTLEEAVKLMSDHAKSAGQTREAVASLVVQRAIRFGDADSG